jgi:pimeloyl-ACP methyl ester carboxylesterase
VSAHTDDLPIRSGPATTGAVPTLLFIHGYLDGATAWDGVVEALGNTVTAVRYDLPGFGDRHNQTVDPQAISLRTLAAEAGRILNAIGTPVYVVGHSLGTQIAELVAAEHFDQVRGLALITPIPLGGTHLPEAAIAPFRGLSADAGAQRAVRAQLSPQLSDRQLDDLTRVRTLARRDVAARYADIWNAGLENAPAHSAYTGATLIIGGGADGFVTAELIDAAAARFGCPQARTLEKGGHWLHVEYPETVASMILDFLDDTDGRSTDDDAGPGLHEDKPSRLASRFADDIVLEGSVFAKPVTGKTQVEAALAATGSLYESLQFTAEAHNTTTSYLQWTARAFGGCEAKGVTVIQRDATGAVTSVALHHRPMSAVLRFSAALRERLATVVPGDHFLNADPCSPR